MSRLVLERVSTKRFGAADRRSTSVDSRVAHGTFVCLLGPSGCGKTTLLRMIAGLEEPSAGRILLDGDRHHRLAAHQRDFGMVFQSLALFPHLTVGDNIAYPLRIRGVGREREQEARVRRASGARASARPRRPADREAFGRPAPARRDRPRAGALAEALPARRAALGARRQAARGDAGGAAPAAAAASASPPSSSPTTSARR